MDPVQFVPVTVQPYGQQSKSVTRILAQTNTYTGKKGSSNRFSNADNQQTQYSSGSGSFSRGHSRLANSQNNFSSSSHKIIGILPIEKTEISRQPNHQNKTLRQKQKENPHSSILPQLNGNPYSDVMHGQQVNSNEYQQTPKTDESIQQIQFDQSQTQKEQSLPRIEKLRQRIQKQSINSNDKLVTISTVVYKKPEEQGNNKSPSKNKKHLDQNSQESSQEREAAPNDKFVHSHVPLQTAFSDKGAIFNNIVPSTFYIQFAEHILHTQGPDNKQIAEQQNSMPPNLFRTKHFGSTHMSHHDKFFDKRLMLQEQDSLTNSTEGVRNPLVLPQTSNQPKFDYRQPNRQSRESIHRSTTDSYQDPSSFQQSRVRGSNQGVQLRTKSMEPTQTLSLNRFSDIMNESQQVDTTPEQSLQRRQQNHNALKNLLIEDRQNKTTLLPKPRKQTDSFYSEATLNHDELMSRSQQRDFQNSAITINEEVKQRDKPKQTKLEQESVIESGVVTQLKDQLRSQNKPQPKFNLIKNSNPHQLLQPLKPEEILSRKENRMKNRKARPLSAQQRNEELRQTMSKTLEPRNWDVPVEKVKRKKDVDVQDTKDELKQKLDHYASVTRMQHLDQKEEQQQFQSALKACKDTEFVNAMYDRYMRAVSKPSVPQEPKAESVYERPSSRTSQKKPQTGASGESGGRGFEDIEDLGLRGFLQRIRKKLDKITARMRLKAKIAEREELISKIDVVKIQNQYIEDEMIWNDKSQFWNNDNAVNEALINIYDDKAQCEAYKEAAFHEEAEDYAVYLAGISNGNTTFADDAPQREPTMINRRFLTLPDQDSNKIEDWDMEQQIVDPIYKFRQYCDNLDFRRLEGHKDFQNRKEDLEMNMRLTKNSSLHPIQPSSKITYLKQISKEVEIALPLITKIKEKEMTANDYPLQAGHFDALKIAVQLEPTMLKKITLINCGLDDTSIAALFKCCQELTQIEYIRITKGEFGSKSIEALKPLVQTRGALQALSTQDLKIQPPKLEALLLMLMEKSYLRQLDLAGIQWRERSMTLLGQLITKNTGLYELDISYASGLRPQHFTEFFKMLSHNRTLRNLNLSWCNFIESAWKQEKKDRNPYLILAELQRRFAKMSPGTKWPSHLVVNGKIPKDEKKRGPPPGQAPVGPPTMEMPTFKKHSNLDELNSETRGEVPDVEEKDMSNVNLQRYLSAKGTDAANHLEGQSEKDAELVKKMASMMNTIQMDIDAERDDENSSDHALTIVEAIYKFIRRDQNLQHLDVSDCNLGQVMIGRIVQGIKCSRSLMGVHLSNNPGLTDEVRTFIQYRLKAHIQQKDKTGLNRQMIEDEQSHDALQEQMQNKTLTSDNLAQQTITIKEQRMKFAALNKNLPTDPNIRFEKVMILQRLIGYKAEIPESGRWRICIRPEHECWICAKYALSYFFWNKASISKSKVPENQVNCDKVASRVNSDFTENRRPYIYGSFSQWQPRKMHSVTELAKIHRQQQKPDFLKVFVKLHELGPGYDKKEDLDYGQLRQLKALEKNYDDDPKLNWRRYIGAMMRFQDPFFAGYEHFKEYTEDSSENSDFVKEKEDEHTVPEPDLFVTVALVKPGKQYYLVAQNKRVFKKEDREFVKSKLQMMQSNPGKVNVLAQRLHAQGVQQSVDNAVSQKDFYLHKCLVPIRSEVIPDLVKKVKTNFIVRVFQKHASVFAGWKSDTKAQVKKMVDIDYSVMKVEKILKTDKEVHGFKNILCQNIQLLQELHLGLLGSSDQPPYLQWNDFTVLGAKAQFAEGNVEQANIDLIFVQVNTNNPGKKGLRRGEFIEALLRIARLKYIDNGDCEDILEAFKRMIGDLKERVYQGIGAEHREKKFWCLEINDILYANYDELKIIYRKLLQPKCKEIFQRDMIDFITKEVTEMKVTIQDAKKCFALARMSVFDEVNKLEEYDSMKLVEFMDFLCRVAYFNFINCPEALPKKLEWTLDAVLAAYNFNRKDPVIDNVVDSDLDISDSDY